MRSGSNTAVDGERAHALIALAAMAAAAGLETAVRPSLEMSWSFARFVLVATPGLMERALSGGWRAPDIQLGAYAGPATTMNSDVHLVQPNGTDLKFEDVSWRGEPFKMPPYYGYRGTYWPRGGRFGAMIDFTHIKAMAHETRKVTVSGTRDGKPVSGKEPITDTFQKLEFTHGYNILTLNALYRRPATARGIRPYFGLGLGISLPHVEMFRTGWENETRTNEYQIAGPTFQLLAGIEWRPSARVSWFLEYKLSCSVNTGRLVGGGTLKTTLCTHQLPTGPSVHLRGRDTAVP